MPHRSSAQAKMTDNTTRSQRVRDSLGAGSAYAYAIENQLAAMALDPEIQRELREIDAEFIITETDGLDGMIY